MPTPEQSIVIFTSSGVCIVTNNELVMITKSITIRMAARHVLICLPDKLFIGWKNPDYARVR